MVVDDQPESLQLISSLLRQANFSVRVVSTGEQVLRSVLLKKPDMILMDVRMPKMNGIETCLALKENKSTADIPVLFLSALHSTEDKMAGFSAGGLDYITKPFSVEELLTRINTHFRLHELQQGLEKQVLDRTHQLQLLNAQMQDLYDHAPCGYHSITPEGLVVRMNQTALDMLGYDKSEVVGRMNIADLLSDRGREIFRRKFPDFLQHGEVNDVEVEMARRDGSCLWVSLNATAVRDSSGKILHSRTIYTDITVEKAQREQLEYLAHYDSLTALPNRVLLTDRLHQAMIHTLRKQQQMVLVFLDLDGFKEINDQYGHDIGDQLLVKLAGRMKHAVREGDTVARVGGDEFVAVLIDVASQNASIPLIERLLDAATQTVDIDGIELVVTASLGVSFYPQSEDVEPGQLLRQADQAMYQVKLTGKNRYQIFDARKDIDLRDYHGKLQSIRQALNNQEFILHYQPKVNMGTGDVIGVEALIRWQHPQLGLQLPARFLPFIDNNSLTVEIGDWVLDTALKQLVSWRHEGIDVSVSVNVSALQLQQEDFVEKLIKKLDDFPQLDRNHLELEILESSALNDIPRVSNIIRQCQKYGVHFAIDDFGTGYSSLTYLKQLPVQTLKIDYSFVKDMLDDPEDLAILEGILNLSMAFHRDVIAEGVETLEHGKILMQLGCKLGQGFGIARPMSAQAFSEWMRSWAPFDEWRDIRKISRDDFSLLIARTEHHAWVREISDFVIEKRKSPPPLQEQACHFSHWLTSDGVERYGAARSFQNLIPIHSEIHALAQKICQLKVQHRQKRALEELQQLFRKRDEMITMLEQLLAERRLQIVH